MRVPIGRREAWLWLGVSLFFVVQVASYVRFTFEQAFQQYLIIFKLPGLAFYRPTSILVTLGLYFWLSKLFPKVLVGPLRAVEEGSFEESDRDLWRYLLLLNGVFCSGVLWLVATDEPGETTVVRLTFFLSLLFLIGFMVMCFVAGKWPGSLRNADTLAEVEGPSVDLSRLVCNVSIWSNGLFLLVLAVLRPYMTLWDCRAYGVQFALVGTVIGLFFGKLDRERLSYVLALLVSILGGPRFGMAAARLCSLAMVFAFQAADHKNLKLALTRTWAFGLGQSGGRVLGAMLGSFYIGLEGGPMGAAFGEALAALFCTRFVQVDRSSY